MKFKYTGDQDAITLRNVTFKAGEAVDLSAHPELAEKVSVLDFFKVVKPRAKRNVKNTK